MKNQYKDISAWLTLAHTPTIGTRTIQKCLQRFSSATDICHAQPIELQGLLNSEQVHAIKHPNTQQIDQTLKWLDQSDHHHIVTLTDKRYPPLLLQIPQPPAILYINGNPDALTPPQLAIIGSRHPSQTGLEYATAFAHALSNHGLCITSGLALGIDGAAHNGALSANGKTIAVLGTGLNNIYPKRHTQLAKNIIHNGCLISEFPLNTQPNPSNFPRRNRIISGLSLGTLVVEAAPKSGSLITARYAMEQNREVFALPGSLRNPAALGCLKLIQDGAKCVISTEDILNEINWLPEKLTDCSVSQNNLRTTIETQFIAPKHRDNPEHTVNHVATNVRNSHFKTPTIDFPDHAVLACVDNDAITTIDQICERSKLPAQKVMAALLNLEIKGHVLSKQSGYIKIT